MQAVGYASNMALGVIGWIAMGIQALASVFSFISKIHDNNLQKEIDAIAKTVENLQERFEELQESIEMESSAEGLRETGQEAKENIEKQIASYEEMIKLEDEKKKTDHEQIEEWKKEIKEQREALDELNREIVSKATSGILDNTFDAARNFVDAWYDAFKETGDGLSGLEKNFDEMFMNLAKQQAALQIVGRYADAWQKSLSTYVNESDTELTPEDAAAWAEEVKATFPELNAALEGFLGVIDDNLSATGQLSGLEEGIAGASEETVQIVAAYLNSIRLFVSDNNTVLKQLRDYTIGSDDTTNPILAQLRIIAQQTNAIRSLLDTATMNNGNGVGFRVYMP
jgi:DNA repair exonuclease SbcCD ATPase subunit